MTLARIWLWVWFVPAALLAWQGSPFQLDRVLAPPGWPHVFGCDAFGRDVLLAVLRASLVSAAFGLGTVLISCTFGAFAGAFIAVSPLRIRAVLLRVLDAFLAFPALLFALAWAAIRGPGWTTLGFALLIGILPAMVRLVYVRAKDVLQEEYVAAAQGLGAGPAEIARKHLIPAVLSFCSVQIPNLFAHALLAEAILSFLGIGAPVGRDTWGSFLAQGKDYLLEAPHIAFGAGLPLVLTVLSLQVLSRKYELR